MSPLSRFARSSCLMLLALAVPAAALAQIDEQDRQNRCANNRARIVELQGQLHSLWNDEHVAKARTVLPTLRRLSDDIDRELRWINRDPGNWLYDYGALERLKSLRAQFMERALSVGVACREEDKGCPSRVIALIEKNIDTAIASRGEREAAVQEVARHQTNLIALRCDLPAQVAMLPDLAGTWYREGRTSLPTSIAQNGRTLIFTNEMKPPMASRGHFVSADEVVADQWEGGLVGIVSQDRRHIAWRNGTNWSR